MLKKVTVLLLSLVLIISLLGCNTKTTTGNKKVGDQLAKKSSLSIPGPKSIQYFADGKSRAIKDVDATYQDVLNYYGEELSKTKLKPVEVTLDDTNKEELTRAKFLAFDYLTPEKISFNFEQHGKINMQVQSLAFILSGKYKGYVFIGDNKKQGNFYSSLPSDDIIKILNRI